jgi:hypothetical protein
MRKATMFSPTKLIKIILKKIITKKNHMGKHFSNPQCFVRKATILFPHDLALLVKKNTNLNSQPVQY